MKTEKSSTRRSFFWQAGAALSVPLGASGAHAATSRSDSDDLQARLAALEDANAIRVLQQTYARLVNAGAHEQLAKLFAAVSDARVDATIRCLSPEDFGEHDVIAVAADRNSATATALCTVRIATAIEPRCSLEEMARQQGDGFVTASERRVLENSYVKQSGVWKIKSSTYRDVPRSA